MVKIFGAFKHKFLWAKYLLKNEGSLFLLKQIPETLFLKRNFYILVYDVNKLNDKNGEVRLPKNWRIVNNDFKLLDLAREKFPNLPADFFFDKIDGCSEFFMMIIESEGEQKPAAICWMYNNQYMNRVIRLETDEIEMKHGVTLPEFRNSGIFSKLVDQMMINIRIKGYKRVINLIEVNNKPSIKIFQKYGFSIIQKWSFRKVLGCQISPLFSTSQYQNKLP